jgi:hypothetical protein
MYYYANQTKWAHFSFAFCGGRSSKWGSSRWKPLLYYLLFVVHIILKIGFVCGGCGGHCVNLKVMYQAHRVSIWYHL